MKESADACPCCSGRTFAACCQPYIQGTSSPCSAEALMRSRYTAYTRADMDYIFSTMKGRALKAGNRQESYAWTKKVEWLGLVVLNSREKETSGYVEFIARFNEDGIEKSIHEISRFIARKGRWYYIDGINPTA